MDKYFLNLILKSWLSNQFLLWIIKIYYLLKFNVNKFWFRLEIIRKDININMHWVFFYNFNWIIFIIYKKVVIMIINKNFNNNIII